MTSNSEKVTCKQCGAYIRQSHMKWHKTQPWHLAAPVAVRLREGGMPFAVIARVIGLSKASVSHRFKIWGKKNSDSYRAKAS